MLVEDCAQANGAKWDGKPVGSQAEMSAWSFCDVSPRPRRRIESVEAGPDERAPLLELTFNYDPEQYGGGRNFGHLAFEVDDIYATCAKLQKAGVTINRPPRDGRMAFVRSPDNISIELLQKGESKAPAEPWTSMPNTGTW